MWSQLDTYPTVGRLEGARSDEERNRGPRLQVRDHERRLLLAQCRAQRAGDVPQPRVVPAEHGGLDLLPARRRADAVAVEEPVVVPRPQPLRVETVPEGVPDCERIEAETIVEPPVDAPPRSLRGRSATQEARGVESSYAFEPRSERALLLLREQQQHRQPIAELLMEASDDAAVEEDPRRERIGKDEPDGTQRLVHQSSIRAAIRAASDAPSRPWTRSASAGVPQAGQPSTPTTVTRGARSSSTPASARRSASPRPPTGA